MSVPNNGPLRVSVSVAGDAVLASAPGLGYAYRVTGWGLVAGGPVNISFKSGTTVTDGPYPMDANAEAGFGFHPGGWFTTNNNEALTLSTDTSVQVTGRVWIERFKL